MLIRHRTSAKKEDSPGSARADAFAQLIFTRCIRLQLAWAAFMRRQASRLPKPAKLGAFVLFIGACSAASIYHVAASLNRVHATNGRPVRAGVHAIRLQRYNELTATVMPHDLMRVESYIRYMDSLARSPGKKIYDSMMLSRPGLLDSARNAIQLFQSQPK